MPLNYLFMEPPSQSVMIDFPSVDGSLEASIKIERHGNAIEITVRTNEKGDYQYTEVTDYEVDLTPPEDREE